MDCNSQPGPGLVNSSPGTRRIGVLRARGDVVRRQSRAESGFTLLELSIVTALISVLLVIGIISGTSATDRRKFEFAVDRLETTLRMARVEAANSARRMKLSFDSETRLPTLLWEPAPLTEPGQFTPHTTCSWRSRIPKSGIAITRCRMTGPDGKPVEEAPSSIGDSTDEEEEMLSITFGPDGTSDSVLIQLESDDHGDSMRAAIRLDGQNNLIETKIMYGPAEEDEDDPFAEDEEEISE